MPILADSVITKVHVILLLLCVRMLCAPILANVNLPVDLLLPNTSMVFAIHWLSLDKCNSSYYYCLYSSFPTSKKHHEWKWIGDLNHTQRKCIAKFCCPKVETSSRCHKLTLESGSGCGSVGRAVASHTRDLQFESSHWQKFIYLEHLLAVNCVLKRRE